MTRPRKSEDRIYLDNAATSFPKPEAVHQAVLQYSTEIGASPGRGSYSESRSAGAMLEQCRVRINELINGEDSNHVIFTLNCSDALNVAIKGIVHNVSSTPHIITTDLDHNSILRPFNKLIADGRATQTRVPCDPTTGLVSPDDIRNAIQPDTRVVALLHGSNVTGTIQDISAIGAIAAKHDVLFLVDAAQTVGHMPLDVRAANIDLLAAPGHKGLLGPLGTGFLYIRPGVEKTMTTLREGGTGSASELDTQPKFMPDRFEPGSHNTPGIIGLLRGVEFILERGVDALWEHEITLMDAFLDAIDSTNTPGLQIFGPPTTQNRCGVFSIRIEGYDEPQHLSEALETQFGLLTRSGLHCAPGAHHTIGTDHLGGTTRLSFGPFLSVDDIRYTATAIATLCNQSVAAHV